MNPEMLTCPICFALRVRYAAEYDARQADTAPTLVCKRIFDSGTISASEGATAFLAAYGITRAQLISLIPVALPKNLADIAGDLSITLLVEVPASVARAIAAGGK